LDYNAYTTKALSLQSLPVLGYMAVETLKAIHTAADDKVRKVERERLERVLSEMKRRSGLTPSAYRAEEASRIDAFIEYARKRKYRLGRNEKGNTSLAYTLLGAVLAVSLGGLVSMTWNKAQDLNETRAEVLSDLYWNTYQAVPANAETAPVSTAPTPQAARSSASGMAVVVVPLPESVKALLEDGETP
jgi:hypothetical protein